MMYVLKNRYEIDSIVGRGGTSVVYKAYDLQAARAVRAIKEINRNNKIYYEIAKKETSLIKELYEKDHSNAFFPNIIDTLNVGDKFYIVQDFLDGKTMEEILKSGPMPYETFIESAKQICSFMEFFHNTGRIHSDMKPENIMVLRPNSALNGTEKKQMVKLKFIDFGTAVKNSKGVMGYTPEYASPEQKKLSQITVQSDIFNVGATFYHMLLGKKPVKVSNETRTLTSAERFVFDKNVNIELKKIIKKCVEDDPKKRYNSCREIYRDICRVEKHSHLKFILGSLLAALICFSVSGFSSYEAKNITQEDAKNNYEQNFNKGNFADAIIIDNSNKNDIYSKLIESYIDDEKLDINEHNFINNQIKSIEPIKKEDSNYGYVMYEIGNAYWLYYCPVDDGEMSEDELEKMRISESSGWFSKAVTDSHFKSSDPESYLRASVFYDIGKLYSEVDKKEKDGTDNKGFYTSMWEDILKVSEYINDKNEVVSARVCQTILSVLSRCSANFRQNGIEKSEILKIVSDIENKVYDNGKTSYRNNYSISIAEKFDTEAVRLKIEMAYAD